MTILELEDAAWNCAVWIRLWQRNSMICLVFAVVFCLVSLLSVIIFKLIIVPHCFKLLLHWTEHDHHTCSHLLVWSVAEESLVPAGKVAGQFSSLLHKKKILSPLRNACASFQQTRLAHGCSVWKQSQILQTGLWCRNTRSAAARWILVRTASEWFTLQANSRRQDRACCTRQFTVTYRKTLLLERQPLHKTGLSMQQRDTIIFERTVVFTFAQKVENLQRPECTVLHSTNKHCCWWVTYCELGVAWF